MFLPVFAMFAGGEENHIFSIMDVIKRIPGVRSNPSQIAFAFKNQHIFPKRGDGVVFQIPPLSSGPRMIFGEQGDGDVKLGSEVLCADAGFGQHGLTDIKPQILCVIRPCARVQVKDQVVAAVIPQVQVLDLGFEVVDVLRRQLVSVQGVKVQDEDASLSRVRSVEPGALDGGQDVLVAF